MVGQLERVPRTDLHHSGLPWVCVKFDQLDGGVQASERGITSHAITRAAKVN